MSKPGKPCPHHNLKIVDRKVSCIPCGMQFFNEPEMRRNLEDSRVLLIETVQHLREHLHLSDEALTGFDIAIGALWETKL